jgi:hypothetical protein
MNTLGFTAEASLYKTTQQYQCLLAIRGESHPVNKVVSQVSRSVAEGIVKYWGFGSVNCNYECLIWGSCGYEEYTGKRCCKFFHEDCDYSPS